MNRFEDYAREINEIKDRGHLITEQQNDNSENIHLYNTDKLVDVFIEEDLKPQLAIKYSKKNLVKSIDMIYNRLNNKGRLFYIGAGTSGRLAVLDASECPPTFCTSPDLVQAIIAGGYESLVKSSEQAEDNTEISIKELKDRKFTSNDCLIGITAGGTTPYVISSLEYAKKLGALTILITSVTKDQSNFSTDIDIRLITGPEIIAGSTRLKAATAAKMALNIISSGVMIKLGKVYKNRMIDLSVTNNKLLDRSIRILCDLLNIDRDAAIKLLEESRGSVKVSILMRLSGMNYVNSIKELKENNDHLPNTLSKLGIRT
ncbi:N-acetylmuramic acid 6-phosphate etherase [Prochlorococcus marinus]|uniref:N-acetylmuramic acid 6-phosphate etherase n=1 Tax=Prochlorococcus marinus TaxID=1219 RepID=UPI0022B4E22E|nr:N-acetylmuramic acid 6-phosphate etherase [Prochlorococcus marinus]